MGSILMKAENQSTVPLSRRVGQALGPLRGLAVRAFLLFYPPKRPSNPGGEVYVNVGCGFITHPAFINVDALVARHIHFIRPIDDLKPFADGTINLVYASHCLEHFSHRQVNRVLTEWRRVLRPGGVLRIGVPDFDQIIALYEYAGRNVEVIQEYLMGGQTYALNSHYTAFTRGSLTARLTEVGFREVRPWQRETDELTSLPDCTGLTVELTGRVFPLSLNLEAVK
jgi:SAM-dependent methyltransferase